ncbi:hypothetical protein BaRGS_00015203 [Batillaria attramentaria]|uniref:Reticulon-like protein n=1 Tax=Batillaria attramentaria TaxID=370345 RepID=A0ABD0L282_9CAEN
MADDNFGDLREMGGFNPESNFTPEDFETLDPPGGSAYESQGQGTIPEQDEEVSTTNAFGGEEPAEEDRYAAGASEADAVQFSSDPLISWGDDAENVSQPSAAVPESQGSALDDLGGLAMGSLASAGLQSAFTPPSPPPAASRDPYPNPPQDREEVSSTEPVSEEPAEKKAAGAWLKNVDPRVLDLIYWRDVRKTGVVFGSMMLVLLSLAFFSLMSVLAYLSLAVLTVTLSFRVYKNIMAAVQKTNDGHPFKQYLEMDITLKEEKVSRVTQTVLQHVNRSVCELRRLFLIEDLVDSIKFGLLLWVLTYVGSWFNGMTLIILLVIDLFTLPKIYETYKVQIDNYVNMARTQVNNVMTQVQNKLPFLKKKAKTQ